MSKSHKNKFGITSVDDAAVGQVSLRRGGGPMSSAVRETVENVAEATEVRVEQRKQNAADARLYRTALEEGRVIWRIPVGDILTTDLPRDRMDLDGVARSDEMDELKASIRVHGQKEPIELYRDEYGYLQLKKGWRRLTSLRALHAETGDERFSQALARVDTDEITDRLPRYVDMVEENILRQDLTFAEMAQVAIEAARDPEVEGEVPEDMVLKLYSALHKTKRSYIRNFVTLLSALGNDLPFPKAVNRDLGNDVARALKDRPELAETLREKLVGCVNAERQNAMMRSALKLATEVEKTAPARDRQKFEFYVGNAKITARNGEFRIKGPTDFTEVPREQLEAAVAAFQQVLKKGLGYRPVTSD
ncbi:MAG: ParB/RepB/Spo0J family partition protein [Paracoccaceae bacterium]